MNNSNLYRLGELAQLFFKLGLIGFGGPAAHIAMMEDEVVNRKQWLAKEDFLDLVGATNLIPGPNSTEMAIHVGYTRAGWPGLIVAGVCFILPAVLITTFFAWVYVALGTIPQFMPLLYGIKPAVLAVVFGALWRLRKTAIKNQKLLFIGLAVGVGVFFRINEVAALLLGGVVGMLTLQVPSTAKLGAIALPLVSVPCGLGNLLLAVSPSSTPVAANIPLWQLGWFFLKVGSVLYGSGYVLVAFLEGGLVNDLGWLTQQQLLDAIAIGQFTPGPVLSTATFIGYLIAGFPGAVVATVGIFLPSFLFVALLNPFIPRLRASKWMRAFLDAVNVSSVALMAVVTLKLALAIIFLPGRIDWVAALIAASAVVLVIRWRLNAAWIVLGGALIGWIANFRF
jgi:chromate transporter